MNCVSFPKMFVGNQTSIKKGIEASGQCIRLFSLSEVGELFGDPDFGLRLLRHTFDQNSYVLRDILIDEIFDKIPLFHPQITILSRNDIKVIQEKAKIIIKIKAINKVDFQPSTFDIQIFNEEEV